MLVASALLIFSVKNACLFLYFMISLELLLYIILATTFMHDLIDVNLVSRFVIQCQP